MDKDEAEAGGWDTSWGLGGPTRAGGLHPAAASFLSSLSPGVY